MTARQRYLDTILFRQPARIPLLPGGPRESTLAAWHEQGLPTDVDLWAYLAELVGVPVEAFHGPVAAPADFRMMPQFEERVLAHRDGHYMVQDWMGATTEMNASQLRKSPAVVAGLCPRAGEGGYTAMGSWRRIAASM